MTGQCDVLISGGMIVDGTGAPGRPGSVAITGDTLRVLDGDAAEPSAGRMIDATGKVVSPGFIDLHSHAGLMVLADPRHEPKVRQGVTTEIIGIDGLSYVPLPSQSDLDSLVEMNSGLDGAPDIAYDWDSVSAYLDRFDGKVAVNIGLLIGNTALRISRLGWSDVPADGSAVADMRAMLRESMAAGALGLSSGLDYPPGAYATTDELAALTNEAAKHGGFYHTHVRYSLGDRFLDPFREAIEIGRRGGGPSHITHFYHRETHPGRPELLLGLVDDARAEGLDITFDCYPYEWASTRMLIQMPLWIQDGGPGPLKERLADRSARERLRTELRQRGAVYTSPAGWADVRLGYFGQPENVHWEGRSLADVMSELGVDAVDAMCDLLLSESLHINQVTSGPWAKTLAPFVVHPHGMFGTDSTFIGEKPSPRSYGSFPRVLGEFVRDRALLGLEEAVRKMTTAPAARLGLRDRGRLTDGYKADVVVFDPANVRSNATYEDPRRFPSGIDYVLVNGQVVVHAGEHTGALPGRVVSR
ncbi:MAG TPA: D-aminoacylase [Candidatus Limnocylindrales bacterium]|nr:D-aminoacylase [Candidatus Limnocylindrales bacterium]